MKDVASAAGVSVMTVSRAFRSDASISETTRKKIRKAAEDLGYVFDSTAANLRQQRTGFVAVIIPSINNANFAETVRGLSDVLLTNGMQVLLGNTNYSSEQEELLVEQFLSRRPDAVVLTGGHHTDRTRNLLRNSGVPVVETWDLPADPVGHIVGFSNEMAMRILVDHLVAGGARRIAFLGGDAEEDPRGSARRRGFQAAMVAQGLDASRLADAGPPPISMREGAVAMETLLARFPDTEAVVCVSDLAAFGALSTCIRQDLRVPDNIAIAGFGAYEIAFVAAPKLTTINTHARKIGERSAELIASLVGASETAQTTVIEMPPELVIGESTRS